MDIQRALPVSIHQLYPNPWNPNRMGARSKKALSESIDRYGQFAEILVRLHPTKKGGYQIIDGEHRYQDLKANGIDVVFVNVIDIGDTDAKKLTLIANEVNGDLDAIAMNALVADLLEQLDGDTEELSFGLPFDAEDMAEFLIEKEELELPPALPLSPPMAPPIEPPPPQLERPKPEKPPEPRALQIPIAPENFEYAYTLAARVLSQGGEVGIILVAALEVELGIVPDVF